MRIPKSTSLILATLAGCTVGPDYKAPEVKVQPSFTEATSTAATRASEPTTRPVPITQWWATFRDPELDSLVDRAMKGNLNLKQASSRVREARYQRGIIGAPLFPQINADGGYQRARGSSNVTIPAGAFGGGSGAGGGSSSANTAAAARSNASTLKPAGSGLSAAPAQQIATGGTSSPQLRKGGPQSPFGSGGFPGVNTDLYEVGFDASWEIDVFGGERRALEAADADIAAAQEDHRDALVSLLAEVARTYVELRGYQRQLSIARQNLQAQQSTLDLTTSKFQAGFVTQLDVARQATQVATTAAALPTLEADIRNSVHTLGVLLGEDPGALANELEKDAPIPPVPPEIPVGLPSDLLRRRPDVRRAERRFAAATARIGEAQADLYPKFSITAALGFDSSKPKHWLDWSSRYWALSPGVSWPLFDAGKIRANIDVRSEQQQQALASYQQTVLTALKDVEDALTVYTTEQLRHDALAQAAKASQQAVDLAKQQYNQGVTDFLTVLDAERAQFVTEDSLAQSDRTISTNLVQLYKALGGGWEVELPPQ